MKYDRKLRAWQYEFTDSFGNEKTQLRFESRYYAQKYIQNMLKDDPKYSEIVKEIVPSDVLIREIFEGDDKYWIIVLVFEFSI